MASADELAAVMDALRVLRIDAVLPEMALHAQAEAALRAAGLAPRHEVVLAPHCRIDFMVGTIGVEIKKNRPAPAPLRSQLARYAACDAVEQLLVLAPRGINLPKQIGGKRVTMMSLERLWGIGLP